ncbi:MAG TPA: GYDIA family GHMP kinase [Salinimicrobium sp.]|nr:GYDIA family GHMP kinase [Salinimicrobium sp.]
MKKSFYSNGKLLLTGEYVVLDGATALSLPTKFGQWLDIEASEDGKIHWKSLDHNGNAWFEEKWQFDGEKFTSEAKYENDKISAKLQEILMEAHKMNPEILSKNAGFSIHTRLNFPRNWGLGTSSTLVNNIADWFQIDAYELQEKTFGGSGFDIASAKNDTPVSYLRTSEGRTVLSAAFYPKFKDEIFFVFLNRKQNSRTSISHYKKHSKMPFLDSIEKISGITFQMIHCENIAAFEILLDVHETLISRVIDTPKIKSRLFPDYPRAIKSLGGWGGDFILATGGEAEKEYFRSKGFSVILDYDEMILG